MKAEERKLNETNRLRTWILGLKDKLRGRTVYMIVGSLVLVTAVILVVWFWRTSVASANSARWMDLRAAQDADEPKKYDEIINNDKHANKVTVKLAKLMKARRIMYGDGMDRLGSPKADDRTAALDKVDEGRKLYDEVANELKDYPILQQEAWLSCAKAEETLLGFPGKDGSGFRGDFNRMIDYLKKAAAINSGSDASKNYDQRIADRTAKQGEIEAFYKGLWRLNDTPVLDFGGPKFPNLPPDFKFPPDFKLPPNFKLPDGPPD